MDIITIKLVLNELMNENLFKLYLCVTDSVIIQSFGEALYFAIINFVFTASFYNFM